MALFVVTGPPASGKSTWVLARAGPPDIVVDFDRLAVALSGPGGDSHDHPPAVTSVTRIAREAAINAALRHRRVVDVYLIHSSPGAKRLAQYRSMGAEVVVVDPGRDVVRARVKTERPRRMYAVVDEWYREQAEAMGRAGSAGRAPAHSVSREW